MPTSPWYWKAFAFGHDHFDGSEHASRPLSMLRSLCKTALWPKPLN